MPGQHLFATDRSAEGESTMRIFRTIFFLSAIAILMPSPPEESGQNSLLASTTEVSAPEVIYAASRTASDVGDFCGRQPTVCRTAGFVASKLEAKAKYGTKLIYEWASEATNAPRSGPAVAPPPNAASQNTLTAEDLIPQWRNPLPSGKS
jgi:hypothetical protein